MQSASTECGAREIGDEPEGAACQRTAEEEEQKKGRINLFGAQPPVLSGIRTCAGAIDEPKRSPALASATLAREQGTIQPTHSAGAACTAGTALAIIEEDIGPGTFDRMEVGFTGNSPVSSRVNARKRPQDWLSKFAQR